MSVPRPVYYVSLGGKERPVRFGFRALAEFCDRAGVSLSDLQEFDRKLSLGQLATLTHVGLADAARRERRPFVLADGTPVTEEDVLDWLDEAGDVLAEGGVLARVMEAFAGALGGGPGAESDPTSSRDERVGDAEGALDSAGKAA